MLAAPLGNICCSCSSLQQNLALLQSFNKTKTVFSSPKSSEYHLIFTENLLNMLSRMYLYPHRHQLQESFILFCMSPFSPINQRLLSPPPDSLTLLRFLAFSFFSLLRQMSFSFCYKMLALCMSTVLKAIFPLIKKKKKNFWTNCLGGNIFSQCYKYTVCILKKKENHNVPTDVLRIKTF